MEEWLLLQHGPTNPFWNMACDEWLLKNVHLFSKPILRIYGWDRLSVTIGYFQSFPSQLASNRAVVRRPTGGALVNHDADLTFTVVLPKDHPWRGLGPNERYYKVHERVYRVFENRGCSTQLALEEKFLKGSEPIPSGRGRAIAQCFAKSSRYDVIVDEMKVAGGAQRVTKDGLLHQGSIQGNFEKVTAPELRRAWESFGVRFEELKLNEKQEAQISELSRSKYSTLEWNHRLC
jgi:lipoyl(octanoyl) transferase